MKMSLPQSSLHPSSSSQLCALDCNLTSICDHIQLEGFNNGSFSDIVVHAMGSTYYLHRLILSRSSYFSNMLHGPWKEANAQVVTLNVDDNNVNMEAVAVALAYLYGHHPRLNDNNAFRVLAAASFLDLQDLCAICTDFIISELWISNFLAFQVFAESQDYGVHGERVRNACWGYLCQCGALELKQVLPNLSSRTLYALLNSDALWIPSEEKRFELALFTLLAKIDPCKTEALDPRSSNPEESNTYADSINNNTDKQLESELDLLNLKESNTLSNNHRSIHNNTLNELADYVVEIDTGVSIPKLQEQCSSSLNFELQTDGIRPSCSYVEARGPNRDMEGPSEDEFPNNMMSNDWPLLPWGDRIVGTHCYDREKCGLRDDEFEAFLNIFEGGSLSYCNMSFEALVNVRKQLEDLGFPCKAVNDGLWLQMLLSRRVQEIVADTCNPGSNHNVQNVIYATRIKITNPNGNNIYMGGNEECRPVRAHARGSVDGLAGIGHGSATVTPNAWPPTRFVYSRVPYGITCRSGNGPPSPNCNEDLEGRIDQNVAVLGDGLSALIQGGRNMRQFFEKQSENQCGTAEIQKGGASSDSSQENGAGIGWDNAGTSSISLDLKTPLFHFPPFRFGVEFKDVHELGVGQVKHSPEAYYAGSLWKVSVQAFNDEDPQGRRTVGLFLHRRKAEMGDPGRKVHMFVDSREKVTVRYKLLCPSKREVMVLGNFKEAGTLLPKAPKGWGWRSALLFDELHHLLQNGALRVAAVLQLVSQHH